MAKPTDTDAKTPGDKPDAPALNFIQDIIEEHNKTGRFGGKVHTRFPPEPNGYLHIGHAKSICLNYGLAVKYGGKFNLRYDDTNPTTEEQEYVDSIRDDVRWLGADWEGREFYASDYFDQLYDWAEKLIREGKAYVDDLPAEEIAKYRGDIKGGKNSPFRDRPVEENLDLFRRMKAGEFPEGSAHPAGEDRHEPPELPPARSDHVPDHAREAPPHRRQVVHLPDVRLRPRRVGLDRGHHALDLHAGVRDPPPALRLVRRGHRHLRTRSRSSSPG